MKLESLKSSKFEAFKGNEIENAVSVVGGGLSGSIGSSILVVTGKPGNRDSYDKSSEKNGQYNEKDFTVTT